MSPTLPPIPTHVIGSHGFPGWFWTALDKIKAGDYGQTDARETFDDATQLAIRDQERAGVDVICDGEMRSEERRVGKEGRSRWWADDEKKNNWYEVKARR